VSDEPSRAQNQATCRPVRESLSGYARGIIGGLIFSLPLLYTMEVWWAGFTTDPQRLLVGVVATMILLLGYNCFAGIRHDTCWAEVVIDSVEEFGLGMVLSACVLALLGRIDTSMSLVEVAGKVIMEAILIAIGVSVGTAQLGSSSGSENDDKNEDDPGRRASFPGQIVIATCGAVLFATNVAPTEEIVVLAIEMAPWKVIALALFSVVLGAIILYSSDFRSSEQYAPRDGIGSMLWGTAMTYTVALLSSAAILWFFGRYDDADLGVKISQAVVLAFPATLGASAGRLLLQSQ
jgi:putative integral membrane protein (TIGR02587 family)